MLIINKIKEWWEEKVDINYSPGQGTQKFIWGLIFLIALSMIMTINLIPNKIDLQVGEVSKSDITAPQTVTFTDQEKTEELKEMAASSAPRVYEEDKDVNNKIKGNINTLFTVVKEKKAFSQEGDSTVEMIKEINENYDLKVTDKTLKLLLSTDMKDLGDIEQHIINIMDRQLQENILPGDIEKVKNKISDRVMMLNYKEEYRQVMINILHNHLKPNMILNEKATLERQREAMDKIEPVKITVQQGEMIVRKGDVVTSDDIKVLKVLGLQKQRINYLNILGIILVLVILIFVIAFYLKEYRKDIWQDNKKLLLLELLVVVIVLLARIIGIFNSTFLIYLIPAAAASILATVLIGTNIAVILTFFLSFLVALVLNNSFDIALISFVGGIVGVFSVSKVTQRSDLVRAGFNVSATLVILVFAMDLLLPLNSWIIVLKNIGVAALNGVLVAILANGLLPYLENAFGLTSSVKLLELSNPSQPLLKRLLVEAPGTYHHSIIVGNLSETAADNIGANSLLARVGAYYHDIGKLKRPYFFTDNQFGGENPHDKISANLSSLIIKSHVKDGVDLARKNKLPQEVIDIIQQHHGKNLISYFYQQALEDSKHDAVEENEFRYDGPLPQSKEAAIIMLADIVEAAVRSKNFNKNDHNRIEVYVKELIREKLVENQLDESDLTLNELDVIADSFVKVLTGIYHHRIEYPENLIKEIKRDDNND